MAEDVPEEIQVWHCTVRLHGFLRPGDPELGPQHEFTLNLEDLTKGNRKEQEEMQGLLKGFLNHIAPLSLIEYFDVHRVESRIEFVKDE